MFQLKTPDAMEGPEERSLLSHPEASVAFWNPLIPRISLLTLAPPASPEAQGDSYPRAPKCCPVQYTARVGKGNIWRRVGKILPQPTSQELPAMLREVLSWGGPMRSLEKASIWILCWQVHMRASLLTSLWDPRLPRLGLTVS